MARKCDIDALGANSTQGQDLVESGNGHCERKEAANYFALSVTSIKDITMLARQIMSTPVVTVKPDATVVEIATSLSKRRISGVPVTTNEGQLLGIVSEGDLIRHTAIEADPKGKWWLASLAHPDDIARAYSKAHGRTAADLMVRHVATIADDATLEEVAKALDAHGIKRLPVMSKGRLVGIITRGDLVHAIAAIGKKSVATHLDNAAAQKAILGNLAEQPWLDTSYINISVQDDAVELRGYIASGDQQQALQVLVGEIDPSRRVDNKVEIGLPKVSDFS
jgi:CBS domain-containing protein